MHRTESMVGAGSEAGAWGHVPLGPCACPLCAGAGAEENAAVPPMPPPADPVTGKPVWSLPDIALHMNRSGRAWAEEVVSFGFLDAGYAGAPDWQYDPAKEVKGFSPFSEAQKAAARDAVLAWDDVLGIAFAESVTPNRGEVRFGNTTTGPGQAWAYLPLPERYNPVGGDIWINPDTASNLQLAPGLYGYATLVHEFGHALGLSHPGQYNAKEKGDGGEGDDPTYQEDASYFQDSRQYTIMSYWNAGETGGRHIDWTTLSFKYAATPMLHDIAAAQRLYGADPLTRAEDTTYGFNSTAGRAAFDFAANALPVVTLWDAGGVDTLDLTGYAANQPVRVDLNEGAFSSVGGTLEFPSLDAVRLAIGRPTYSQAQYDGVKARHGATDALMKDNVAIAYGTVIENAVGGQGDDRLVGNAAANMLDGGLGADILTGGGGDDIFRFLDVADGGRDRITDFDLDGDDRIDLRYLDAIEWADGVQPFAFIGTSAFTGPGQVRAAPLAGDMLVEAEMDGDGVADLTVTLVGVASFDADDLLGLGIG